MTARDPERFDRFRQREPDCCAYLSRQQVEDLVMKVESNHIAAIRNEHVEVRLKAVEMTITKLCDRITLGMWSVIGSLFVATGTLVAAIWHIVRWIQELIEHNIILS